MGLVIYRSSIKQVICQSTLTGSKLLDDRSIIKKAKAAIAECKILLSFLMDFLVDGAMPSGMNEDDALQHVLNKAYQENAADLDDDDNLAVILFAANFSYLLYLILNAIIYRREGSKV